MSTPQSNLQNSVYDATIAREARVIDEVGYTTSMCSVTMPDGHSLWRTTLDVASGTSCYYIDEWDIDVSGCVAYAATTEVGLDDDGNYYFIDTITNYNGRSYTVTATAETNYTATVELVPFVSYTDAITSDETFGSRAYASVSQGIPIFRIGTDKNVYNNENRILTEADTFSASNIDWTTLTDDEVNTILMSAPVVSTTSSGPYALSITLRRCGKIVTYYMSGFPSATFPSSGTSDEAIPTAYRPTAAAVGVIRTSSGSTGTVGIGRVYANGTFNWWLPASIDSGTELTFCTTYFTNADWPE